MSLRSSRNTVQIFQSLRLCVSIAPSRNEDTNANRRGPVYHKSKTKSSRGERARIPSCRLGSSSVNTTSWGSGHNLGWYRPIIGVGIHCKASQASDPLLRKKPCATFSPSPLHPPTVSFPPSLQLRLARTWLNSECQHCATVLRSVRRIEVGQVGQRSATWKRRPQHCSSIDEMSSSTEPRGLNRCATTRPGRMPHGSQ